MSFPHNCAHILIRSRMVGWGGWVSGVRGLSPSTEHNDTKRVPAQLASRPSAKQRGRSEPQTPLPNIPARKNVVRPRPATFPTTPDPSASDTPGSTTPFAALAARRYSWQLSMVMRAPEKKKRPQRPLLHRPGHAIALAHRDGLLQLKLVPDYEPAGNDPPEYDIPHASRRV